MSTEKRRVLVAGATGNLGGLAARQIQRRGFLVRVLDVGGPEVPTHRTIARLAFTNEGKLEPITSVPTWAMRGLSPLRGL